VDGERREVGGEGRGKRGKKRGEMTQKLRIGDTVRTWAGSGTIVKVSKSLKHGVSYLVKGTSAGNLHWFAEGELRRGEN